MVVSSCPRPVAVAALAACLLAGAARAAEPTPARPLVAVSVLPQAYFVERLAGDAVEVAVMVPPGASPELYEPTMGQMRTLMRAAVYVKVGHPHFTFERTWLERLLADRPDVRLVDNAAGLHGLAGDPHVWVSPRLVRAMLPGLAEALRRVRPDRAAAIARRRERFEEELTTLDRQLAITLEPVRGRAFLVHHPAWGYLAHDYGLVQLAIEREHKEPDPHTLAAVIDEARAAGITTVITQPQRSRRVAELVAQELGGRVAVLDPLARDWAGNLALVGRALRRGAGRAVVAAPP